MAFSRKIAGCLIVFGLAGFQSLAEDSGSDCDGGLPVQADELAFYVEQLRTDVASRLMREHGLQQSEAFWTTPVNGVSPEAVLRAEALRAIGRAREIQELAVSEGILAEVKSYPQLVEAFHTENQRRKAMKACGEVFYGPVQYRQDVWFKVWFEQLNKALNAINP